MVKENNELEMQKEKNIKNSSKNISRSFKFSFFMSYGTIPISLITTWLIARNITPDYWGIFIYAEILVQGSNIILSFFPPAMNQTILYKSSILIANGKKEEAKGIFIYCIKIRIIIQTLFIIGYLVVSFILINNEDSLIQLRGKLIAILSIQIMIIGLNSIYSSILNAIKNFKLTYYAVLIEYISLLIGYFIVFSLNYNQEEILINMAIAFIISRASSTPIYYYNYKKNFSDIKRKKMSWNKIKESTIFGLYFSISGSLEGIYQQVYYGILENHGNDAFKTYYKIGKNLVNQTSSAINFPTGSIFPDLEENGQREDLVKIFTKMMEYTTLINIFIVGFLFFVSNIYLLIIYPPEYYHLYPLIQVFIFIIYFNNIISSYNSIFAVIHKEKNILYVNTLKVILLSIFSLIGFKTNGLSGMITFQVIGFLFVSIIVWFLGNKLFSPLKIRYSSIFNNLIMGVLFIVITFFISKFLNELFVVKLSEEFYYLSQDLISWKYITLENVNIIISSLFSLSIFLILFILFIVIFRIINKSELDKLLKMGIKIPFYRLIKKFLRT